MFITDKAELLPHWLRFVSGVVDTEDLPLNVSREMLQTTPVLARIRKALIGRVMSELKTRAKEAEDYNKFCENFGADPERGRLGGCRIPRRDRAAAAFRSSTQEGWTSLPDYVSPMQEGQDTIYYLSGDKAEALKTSPQLEGLSGKGREVLLMSDSDRRLLAGTAGQLRGQEAAQRHPGGRGPGKDEDQPDISALLAAMKTALGTGWPMSAPPLG